MTRFERVKLYAPIGDLTGALLGATVTIQITCHPERGSEAGVGWNDHVRSRECGRLSHTA